MKKTILSFAFASCSLFALAQIPNASFENWTSGNPDGWSTANVPPTYISTSQSNQAHAGSSAAKLGVYTVSSTNVSGFLETAFGTTTITQSDSLTGWYKSSLGNGDQLAVLVFMFNNANVVSYGNTYFNNQSNYTRFAIGLMPITSATVDSVTIEFLIYNPSSPDINSYAIIDQLQMGSAVSGIHETQNTSSISLFPNPATELVHFGVPEKSTLELYSAEGKLLLSENVNEGTASLDLSAYPEGMLVLVLRNEEHLFRQELMHTR